MGKKKYVAYVGTYTHGTSKGIQVYDVNVEDGTLTERSEVQVSNASYTAVSKNGKFLYSIEDEGVAVFQRDENGDLTRINSVDIDGMRGCFLATDVDGRYLYVAGYHDGKVTVVHTHQDGSLGSVMDGVFHTGLGSVAERNFRPHVNCVRPTPDNKYLCAVDNGIDQVKIYRINKRTDKLELVDILRCPRESGPRIIRFSADGRFTVMTAAEMHRSLNCCRAFPPFRRVTQMYHIMQPQVWLLRRMADICSALLQGRIQFPCMRSMNRQVFSPRSLPFPLVGIILRIWLFSRIISI